MKEGQQIRLNGQGQSGVNGGENGDLYIEIQYKDTDRIRVEG
ncbi:MAG: DNA-binding protein, partial [Acinetobacter sp.]|nr:DNA-binding protein [Acinetobacter sp.]